MGRYPELEIQFNEFGDETQMGDSELLFMCRSFSKRKNEEPIILIFDRDNQNILKDVTEKDIDFKNWGNNVFSFAIPIPAHRSNTPDICIELYYLDKDLKRKDSNNRRLYLSDEFIRPSGTHISIPTIFTQNKKFNKVNGITIIDNDVFNIGSNNNVALSKDSFSELIYNNDALFQNIDFSEFNKIFDVIEKILLTI